MSIKVQLRDDLAEAMRAGDTEKRNTLRLLLAAIKQAEVDEQQSLDDSGVQAVLAKQAKQRRESVEEYERAGRSDLAAQEQEELMVIEQYLPQQMTREQVEELASQAIADVGASSSKDMGKVMGLLMPQLKGKADGRMVNEVVRELLQ
ncbi:MAG: GatB/YqeY domain-containing protein [Candidatus Promineifilaceae bacterium]|nr:GatB/YqeY domain-containing protein [Candidatus Promineifilaceae bacterium]